MSKVFIVAVENSGDQIGADLIEALRSRSSEITCMGLGGPAMAARGVSGLPDLSAIAVLGFWEGLRAYRRVLEYVNQVSRLISESQPDAVILIDSWGFMIRLAKRLRQNGFTGQIIKYVAPQVWAMRSGRAKTLACSVDHLLSLHTFDAPYFEAHGLSVTYVGHAVFDTTEKRIDKEEFKKRNGMAGQTVMGIFFGSRRSELASLVEPFCATMVAIKADYPGICFISCISDSLVSDIKSLCMDHPILKTLIKVPQSEKHSVFSVLDMALACSGTMTSELACAGVPTVVAYRLHPLTYWLGRWFYRPRFASIVNIMANQSLMPEFIQHECKAEKLTAALRTYLEAPKQRQAAADALLKQTHTMRLSGGRSSAERAAEAIWERLSDG